MNDKIINSNICNHPMLRWFAHKDGVYRLGCHICAELFNDETYLPGTLEPFDNFRGKDGR